MFSLKIMFRNSLYLVFFFIVHLTCDAQSNRDLLFSETWYTAEGLVMTFDSSGVTWEGSKHKYIIDEHAIRHTNKTELIDGQDRNHIYANYQVHTDSLILEFVHGLGLWMCPPLPRLYSDVEDQKPTLVLYTSEYFKKKVPLDNFISIQIDRYYYRMNIESNGEITLDVNAQLKLADRPVYGVYKGSLDSIQLRALKTRLIDSGFFQSKDINCAGNIVCGFSSEFTCRTSNYPFVRREEDVPDGKLQKLIHDMLLSAESWDRNGMQYYGRQGELEEPMEELILTWKPEMPEKRRIAVSGPIRFIEKVSTLDSTAYVYSIKVDTVYGDPDYDPISQARQSRFYPGVKHLFNKELIVVSSLPISTVSNYYGLVLTYNGIQTLTWQSDHTGRPYANASYFELQETFPVDGVAVRFIRSPWDYSDGTIAHLPHYQKWPPKNLASSNFEFKLAKAVRKAQGQKNYIRRDRNGSILPLVE